MNKNIFNNFIKKYYLSGLINSAIWNVNNNKIFTKFITEDNSLLGYVELNGEFNIELESKIGIYDTEKLLKIINILDENISFKFNENYILFQNNEITIKYNLCNINLIKLNIPTLNELSNKLIEIDLNTEFINKFIKIKNSLNFEKFFVNSDVILNKLEFIFNESSEIDSYGNVIKFNLNLDVITADIENIPFNAEIFKIILESNKDFKQGKMQIYSDGLIKLEFKNEFITSNYYLIRLL